MADEARGAAWREFHRTEVQCLSATLAFNFAFDAGVVEGRRQALEESDRAR